MIKLIKNNVKCQGHNAACLRKGIDLSNNVCEYEVNRLINEKVNRGNRNFNASS